MKNREWPVQGRGRHCACERRGIIRANIKNWLWNGTMSAIEHGGKAAGIIVAAVAINAALESGLHAAEVARSYAKNVKAGNGAYADLDAVEIAIDVENATGNYFMAYEALDILLLASMTKEYRILGYAILRSRP
jgi:hypothetical protein